MKNCEREDFQKLAAVCIQNRICLESTVCKRKIDHICGIEIPDDWVKWMNEECAPQQILDQKEHDYLESIIRLFKQHNIVSITKNRSTSEEKEYLSIVMCDQIGFSMPFFARDSMYIGMKAEKHYTLEELGL
jgi:hypothetical protein